VLLEVETISSQDNDITAEKNQLTAAQILMWLLVTQMSIQLVANKVKKSALATREKMRPLITQMILIHASTCWNIN
jgi:hypothetical protein